MSPLQKLAMEALRQRQSLDVPAEVAQQFHEEYALAVRDSILALRQARLQARVSVEGAILR